MAGNSTATLDEKSKKQNLIAISTTTKDKSVDSESRRSMHFQDIIFKSTMNVSPLNQRKEKLYKLQPRIEPRISRMLKSRSFHWSTSMIRRIPTNSFCFHDVACSVVSVVCTIVPFKGYQTIHLIPLSLLRELQLSSFVYQQSRTRGISLKPGNEGYQFPRFLFILNVIESSREANGHAAFCTCF